MRLIGLSFFLAIFLLGNLCLAEKPAADEKDKNELPKSGALSSSLRSGTGNRAVEIPWGGTDQQGENSPPITGSVSRLSDRQWLMKLFNNTKSRYSVDIKIVQYNVVGKSIKTDNLSYSLSAGEGTERKLTRAVGAEDAQLELVRWREVGKPAK